MGTQKITIGGNRVGSGNKMKAALNNYYRSTHNLSEKFKSSAGAGILYPCLVKPAMRGDSFDIEINADCRTIPTKGPLFGSYKMQIDVYQCPIRLYQGILHNNPLAIGLQMNKVKLPMLNIADDNENGARGFKQGEFSKSCLMKYLGMSGIGTASSTRQQMVARLINAVPALAYYDIYKNYYANKQEEIGYIIGVESNKEEREPRILRVNGKMPDEGGRVTIDINWAPWRGYHSKFELHIEGKDLSPKAVFDVNADDSIQVLYAQGYIAKYVQKDSNNLYVYVNSREYTNAFGNTMQIEAREAGEYITNNVLKLIDFPLTNIDEMRYQILGHHQLGAPLIISRPTAQMPYASLVNVTQDVITMNAFPLNGLCLKTYQNDIFNNWLNTEWIEGNNGINEMTKVATTGGAFTMDALNLAQKLYNMLNRVALAGNTYEDWQDVVYEQTQRRQIESPIYCGGMSQEVVFDEIVQTAPADAGGTTSQLGTLGGRGRLLDNKKGGKIHIKCDEACFIIAIVSLTPRISYTQGNEFYMTELQSLDDFHKPALDGIGFQDLIGERLAWWDTKVDNIGNITHRSKIGKLPAWIEYMTSVDKAYGDFADESGKAFMSLNRNYERTHENLIADATTYIDPSKYNYAFAYSELEAQNFWIEVQFKIKARRLMSARIIPNV